MSTELYRVSRACWAVKSNKHTEVQVFETVELAAECLESIGIPPDEVDMALMEMAGHGHTRAQFGDLKGTLIFTDEGKLDELVGVA